MGFHTLQHDEELKFAVSQTHGLFKMTDGCLHAAAFNVNLAEMTDIVSVDRGASEAIVHPEIIKCQIAESLFTETCVEMWKWFGVSFGESFSCFTEERKKPCGFGVNDDWLLVFGWTSPLSLYR